MDLGALVDVGVVEVVHIEIEEAVRVEIVQPKVGPIQHDRAVLTTARFDQLTWRLLLLLWL